MTTFDRLTAAARDVIAERKRQIDAEGWTPEHDDDDHMAGDIAKAAAAYALSSAGALGYAEKVFPWDEFKPKDQRRDLVRAGALILAEIERIDRRDEAARREAEECAVAPVTATGPGAVATGQHPDANTPARPDAPPPPAPVRPCDDPGLALDLGNVIAAAHDARGRRINEVLDDTSITNIVLQITEGSSILDDLIARHTEALRADAKRLREALKWALPLAQRALEDHRLLRLKGGNDDIHGKRKDGTVVVGLWQNEVDQEENARAALAQGGNDGE